MSLRCGLLYLGTALRRGCIRGVGEGQGGWGTAPCGRSPSRFVVSLAVGRLQIRPAPCQFGQPAAVGPDFRGLWCRVLGFAWTRSLRHKGSRMDWIRRRKWWLFGLIGLAGLLLGWERWRLWRDHRYDDLILVAARQHGVEPALIKAVVWRESRFNARARGRRGEVGLMQIRSGAASDWAKAQGRSAPTESELLQPALNMQVGAWYLARLLRRYQQTDNPLAYALADYNAGRSNVLRWLQGPAATNSAAFLRQLDFAGTRAYVRSVLHRYHRYQPHFPGTDGAAATRI